MNKLGEKIMMMVLVILVFSMYLLPINTNTKYGVGVQSSFPAWGLSGSMDLKNSKLGVQGILGIAGYIKTISAKVLYKFKQKEKFNTYGYGIVGLWSYEGESTFGLGGGIGIEWDWRAVSADLPEVWWNIEVGFGSVNLSYYNYTSMTIGIGIHYRFK